MKKIKWIALLAALIVGVGLYQFLTEIGKPVEIPHTNVVVAAVNIPQNTMITAEMVTLAPVATEAVLPNHLTEVESVVGLVMNSDVYAGEQVVTDRLVQLGEASDKNDSLAYVIEPGMRAVTIAVNSITGIDSLIKPGNHVDLILNYTYEKEDEEKDGKSDQKVQVAASRTLIQDVAVLAVGSALEKNGAAEYTTVTLMVTPEDAVLISYGEYTGNIRLILRSSLDEEQSKKTEVDLETIRGEKKKK